jgi:putative transcriptional regulator
VVWLSAAALALVLATSTSGSQAARPSEPSEPPSREAPPVRGAAGRFLVASETMTDPRFERAVVYMLRHDRTGALGLVVNRPLGTVPMARVLESLGRDREGAHGDIRLHHGGPVEPGRGFVLHSPDWRGADSREVQEGVLVTSDPAIFDALARGGGPQRSLFAVGYAGWAPGQLERELTGGFWIVVDADAALLFDDDAETKWQRATARRKILL